MYLRNFSSVSQISTPDHMVWQGTELLMACEASYEERQEDEVDFLQAVFPGDFQDLRVNDSWKVRQQ